MDYQILVLEDGFDRSSFDCGEDSLNNYIKRIVSQDRRRNLALCFAMIDEDNIVKGYFTLSNASISKEDIPKTISKRKIGTYNDLPVTLLGRLAIDKSVKGKGYGEILLMDALSRCYELSQSAAGSMSVIVDPLNENATEYYKKYGFIELTDSKRMFLMMDTIGELF